MTLDEYNLQLQVLKSQLINLANKIDGVKVESDDYDIITNQQIEVQDALIALDNRYNAERENR